MDDRDRDHLVRLIEHAEAARAYASARGATWWEDRVTLDAVMMRLSQVAEAARRTSPEALAEASGVRWSDVKAIRSKIVHDYDEVDVEIIRQTVSEDLGELIANVRRAIR